MTDWGLRAIAALLALAVAVPITAIVIGRVLAPELEPPYLAGVQGTGRPLRWLGDDRVLFEKPGGRGVAVLTVDGEVPLDLDLVTEFGWAESPDGEEAAYVIRRGEGYALYVGPVGGQGSPRLLAASDEATDMIDHVMWTRDGRHLVFSRSGSAWAVPSVGGEPVAYVPEFLARASATVEIPPAGPHADYVPVEPTYVREPAYLRLPVGRRIGAWTVVRPGDELMDGSGARCRFLLRSPDGRFLACAYSAADESTGVSDKLGAIVVAS